MDKADKVEAQKEVVQQFLDKYWLPEQCGLWLGLALEQKKKKGESYEEVVIGAYHAVRGSTWVATKIIYSLGISPEDFIGKKEILEVALEAIIEEARQEATAHGYSLSI